MDYRIKEMAEQIVIIKKAALELQSISPNIQAVDKNVDRIMACIKMLEINVSDITEIQS